ncbi:hypothetical protein ACWX0K_10810 [Nitrobacteraceae bacterium UC4446_H13]
MTSSRLTARDIRLLRGDTVVARGVTVIDGAPPAAVLLDGDVYLPSGEVHGALLYARVEALRAGSNFEAVP